MGTLYGARVLVTGGAGAIGSHLSAKLLARGATVYVIDNLTSGREQDVPRGASFFTMSILDPEIESVFSAGLDSVFHLAARFANQNSIDHPEDDLAVNAAGTLRLLELARRYPINRFVYASTSCVTQLRTPYAISKMTGEQYTLFYGEQHRLPVSVVRYYNSYGPHDYPGQYRSVVPNFLWAAMQGRPLTIKGSGLETRDFTYVEDAVEGTIRCAERQLAIGRVFPLGAGRPVSILHLAECINALTGNQAGVELQPRREWDTVTDRKADITLAQELLDYRPSTDLVDGLSRTHAWLQSLSPDAVCSGATVST